MIVPSTRLLIWVAIVALPFGIVMAAVPSAVPVSIAIVLLLLAIAVCDAAASPALLDGLQVKAPDVIRASKDRLSVLGLQFRSETGRRPNSLRLGLAWPSGIDSSQEALNVSLPDSTDWATVDWELTPRQRGRYVLNRLSIETASRLGFWSVRRPMPISSEIRVYPNLLTERKAVAALFLNRGGFGVHTQRQVGKGREFEKLREYIAGDALDDIHWKATAKRGQPVTKVHQIERTQEVYVVVDSSRLSGRVVPRNDSTAHAQDTTLERFIVASLVMGLAAEQQGDLFGLLTFSDRIDTFVAARSGKEHYNVCRDALYTLEPRTVSPDFDELMSFIRQRLRRRALIVFLTALDDALLAEQFTRSVELIARHHYVLVNMLQPPGVKPLFSQLALKNHDELYDQLAGHLRWQKLRELQKVLQRRAVHFTMLQNERLTADLVSQYLNVRKRQLL